jgi:hypothetical protein
MRFNWKSDLIMDLLSLLAGCTQAFLHPLVLLYISHLCVKPQILRLFCPSIYFQSMHETSLSKLSLPPTLFSFLSWITGTKVENSQHCNSMFIILNLNLEILVQCLFFYNDFSLQSYFWSFYKFILHCYSLQISNTTKTFIGLNVYILQKFLNVKGSIIINIL